MLQVHAEGMKTTAVAVAVLAIGCVAAGCGQSSPRTGRAAPIGPAHLVAADFVSTVDHPYFPLVLGTVWEYEVRGTEEDGERVMITVLNESKVVDGVPVVVVQDRTIDADGELVELTYDWYAQDKVGNVWYLGERTTVYEDGEVSRKGSWEAGVDDARAGLIMVAKPRVGKTYQQSYDHGEAEDVGKILSIDEIITVPAGRYENVIRTADITPLEPELIENKWYARDVGLIQEADLDDDGEKLVLVKLTRP